MTVPHPIRIPKEGERVFFFCCKKPHLFFLMSHSGANRLKSNDHNVWPPPIPGLDYDIEGPTADHLLDVSHIYDQVVYQDIRPSKEEWTMVDET